MLMEKQAPPPADCQTNLLLLVIGIPVPTVSCVIAGDSGPTLLYNNPSNAAVYAAPDQS